MTKIIKIIAAVASILLLAGTFFKTSHWPGANVLIVVGSAAGILLFLLLIYAYLGKLATGFGQFTGILSSLALIVSLLAFVFKLLHWPGAGKLIWIADIGIFLAGAFLLSDGIREDDAPKSALKIIAGFFILLLGAALILST